MRISDWSSTCALPISIRDRNHRARYFGPMYWILTVLVGAAGLGVAILGTKIGAPLFQVFGAVGVAACADSVVQWRRAPPHPRGSIGRESCRESVCQYV